MTLRAAELCFDSRAARHRVQLQSEVQTAGDRGGYTLSWSTYATVWAIIRSPSTREIRAGEQQELAIDHVVEIRHRTDVSHGDRILYDGRPFSIVGIVNPQERDVKLVLSAVEKRPTTTEA